MSANPIIRSYTITGNAKRPATLIVMAPDDSVHYCRAVFACVTAKEPIMNENAVAQRVRIDIQYVDTISGEECAFSSSTSFSGAESGTNRAEFNLARDATNVVPMGTSGLYLIIVRAPVDFVATIRVQHTA